MGGAYQPPKFTFPCDSGSSQNLTVTFTSNYGIIVYLITNLHESVCVDHTTVLDLKLLFL